MKFIRRYNPKDYKDIDGELAKHMELAYSLLEKGGRESCDKLETVVSNIYYFIKNAIVYEEIDETEGYKMQDYFLGFLE